jgi:hypothetical protein
MNYIPLGGTLSLRYAYVDLNTDQNYVADSLLYRHRIPVRFKGEFIRDTDNYRVILCRIPRKYRSAFEKAMEELKAKMNLLGHTDYEDYCEVLMKELENA